jgi:hypothetical protein
LRLPNRELVRLYWDIGRQIVERQESEGWGKGIVDRLAKDSQQAFPGLAAFSPSNVSRMRAFYLAYTKEVANSAQPVPNLDGQNLPAAVAEIPWGHNVVLLFKIKDPHERLWYAQQTVQHGWSRTILEVQIESNLYSRQGKAVTNFAATLPPRYLLKTGIAGRYIDRRNGVHERAQAEWLRGNWVGIAHPVLAELAYRVEDGPNRDRNMQRLARPRILEIVARHRRGGLRVRPHRRGAAPAGNRRKLADRPVPARLHTGRRRLLPGRLQFR